MEDVLQALRAAAESTRLRLLVLLAGTELTVSEITQVLNQSQPRVSRHLKLLGEAGLLSRVREGAWVFYRTADEGNGGRVAQLLAGLVDPADPDLAQDRERMEQVRRARAQTAADYFARNAEAWAHLRALHVPEAEVEAAILELAGPSPLETVLDLGTGTGRILEILAPCTRRGIGIDQSHEMLAIARANLERAGFSHCHARHGDLFNLPFTANPKGGVDLAVLHQVLHYLDDPAAAVREASRVLAPQGRILIADFAPHDLEFLRTEHAHRRLGFSDREVAQWASAAGFEVSRRIELPPTGGEGKLTVVVWQLSRPKASLTARGAAA